MFYCFYRKNVRNNRVNDVIFVMITDKAIVGEVIIFKNKKGEIITHRVEQKLADTYMGILK